MALRAAFPSGPLTDDDGNLSAAWRGFFQSLYSRTGDAQGVSTPDISAGLATEAAARAAADTALSVAIVAERTARQSAVAAGDPTKLPLAGGTLSGSLRGTTAAFSGNVGFNGAGLIAKPTVTGSKGGNAALASLLTALAAYGLITDSST